MVRKRCIMNNKMKEYELLRDEIMQKIGLQNTLLTFTITTCFAAYAFALSNNNIMFYLIPFCIILPMSIRIAYYTSALTKIAAYMEVFLEEKSGYIWETRNRKLVNKRIVKKKNKLFDFTVYQHNECLILSLVSYFLLAYHLIVDSSQMIFIKIVFLFLATVLLLSEVYITHRINHANKEKDSWVESWKEIKDEEYSEDEDIN